MAQGSLSRFDHLVVVMFENRSFDNLLGYLYEQGAVPQFDGLAGGSYSNPVPWTSTTAMQRCRCA